jgi:hypothetical protein
MTVEEMEPAVIDNVRGVIEWTQGLSTLPKGVISLVVLLVSGLVLVLLWQRPPEIAPDKPLPGATIQTGNAASSGQTGGVTAGLYINQAPPVTAQQKEEALSRLQAEIEELSDFPNRPDTPEPRTLLENLTINKMPHQLFVILGKYYKQTILSVPKLSGELYDYKVQYYRFESREHDFENETTTTIGKIVEVRFRQGWEMYFRYFLLRSFGFTEQQIVDGGTFLNLGITWTDAERVFNELTKDPAIAEAIAENRSSQNHLLAAATRIISNYKSP